MFRNVLILINYFPAIDDIQRHQQTRVIDNALQEPTYGNPWLIRHVFFTIGETIRSNNLIRTTFECIHEPLGENRRGGANGRSEPKRFKGKDMECGVKVMKVSSRKSGGGVRFR